MSSKIARRINIRPLSCTAMIGAALVGAMLHVARIAAQAAEEPAHVVSGRVVDDTDKPVAGVALAWFWSANGIPRDDDGTPWPSDEASYRKKIEAQGWKKLSGQVGTMEPYWSLAKATTDGEGRFSIAATSNSGALLAMDGPRRRGALAIVDPEQQMLVEPLVLRKLVRVHGNMACTGPVARPKWTNVYVDIQPDVERRPLDLFRMMQCSSLNADFSFLVPPGKYTMEVYSTDPEARVKEDVNLDVDGGQADVDLGTAELEAKSIFLESRIRQWQARGDRGDYKQHVGRAPPPWFIADARGAGKDVQIADYRGKWVVLEFWNLSCTVCLKHDLPAWTKYYQEHRQQRDRFEILSICVDVDEDLDSVAQVEKRLERVIKHVWNGQDLPFPLLLDSKLKTWQSFGLDFMAQTLLVDPQGNLTAVVGHKEVRERLTRELDTPK